MDVDVGSEQYIGSQTWPSNIRSLALAHANARTLTRSHADTLRTNDTRAHMATMLTLTWAASTAVLRVPEAQQ